MAFSAEVRNGSGVKQGSGPIDNLILAASITSRLSKAGEVSVTVPPTDPKSALLQPANKPVVTLLGETSTGIQTFGRGWIRKEATTAGDDPKTVFTGPDQISLLARRTVGNLKLNNGTTGPMLAANVLPAIIAFLPSGWTFIGTPSKDIYHEFKDETVLAALLQVVKYTSDDFALTGDKTITWYPSGSTRPSSGIRAVSDVDPAAAHDNPRICLITDQPKKTVDYTNTVSRIIPGGSGNGSAVLKLTNTTRTTGDPNYTLNAAANYIAYTPSEAAADDVIEYRKDFKDVAAQGTGSAHDISAANALFDVAYEELKSKIVPVITYEFSVTKVAVLLVPGMTIQVHYDAFANNTYQWISIHITGIINEITYKLNSEGFFEVDKLSIIVQGRVQPQTDASALASLAQSTSNLSRHPQTAERALAADGTTGFSPTTGKVLTLMRSMTLDAASDGNTIAFVNGGTVAFIDKAQTFTQTNTFNGATNTVGNLTMSGTNVAVYTHNAATTVGLPLWIRTIADAATTPGIGFGSRVTFQAHSDTKAIQTVGVIDAGWGDPANATRRGRFLFQTSDTTVLREFLRGETISGAAGIGFLGATAKNRTAAYTQTFATASRTHAAYTANAQATPYTGAADGEAKLVDLNALRVAVENLRAHHESTSQVLNQVIDDFQSAGFGLLG